MPTLTNLLGSGNSALTSIASLGVLTAASGAMTATGTTQGNAVAVLSDFNVFTTVAAGTGAILPANGPNVNATDNYFITNHGANALLVYPAVGGKISTGATNAGFSVAAGKLANFLNLGSNNWAASVSA